MAKTPVAPRAAKPARASAADGSTAPPVKPKRPRKPKVAAAKTGRPSHVPTEQNRVLVTILRANGIDPADIAREVKCSERTLYKYYAEELEHGLASVRSKMGGLVVKMAFGGNLTAAIFWLKTHGGPGWQQVAQALSGGGDDGGGSGEPPKIIRVAGGFKGPR